ncbi:lipocalin family protein [candidate division KSB1 bacterium]|nr:lipocalin family protein [candidate division KSB1 bacterium]
MNNQKIIFVACLCFLLFTLFFSACEKDSPTKPKDDMSLVGTWDVSLMGYEHQAETITYTESQLDSMGIIWTLKFEEDGTAEQTTNMSGPLVTFPGTWSTSGENLTMILTATSGETATLVYKYAIDGNILKINWSIPAGTEFEAEFTKQN